jgi:hypothetical protein
MQKIITLLLLCIAIDGIAQTNKSKIAKQPNIQFIKFEEENYSFEYPSTWVKSTMMLPKTKCNINAPLENAEDKFKENVNLVVEDLTKRKVTDIKSYFTDSEAMLKKYMPNSKITTHELRKSSVGDYIYLEYDMSAMAYNMHITQYYYYKDGKGYIITFTIESAEVEKYKPLTAKVLNSFKFTK